MATYHWINVAGGNFDSSLDWSPNTAFPIAGDTADLTNALTGPYNVDITGADAAAVINIGAANAELVVETDGAILTVGTINMTDGTLAVVSDGVITGGTIIAQPAGDFIATGGTLDAMTFWGTLGLLGVAQSSLLTITTSLDVLNTSGSGPGEIDITGPGAEMDFDGTMTLNGTGGNLVLNIGTSSAQSQFLGIGSAAVLTLGANVSFNQSAAGSTIDVSNVGGASGGTLVNNGTMSFTSGAGSGAFINPSNFINNGLMTLTGGGGPSFAGEDLEVTPLDSLTIGATGHVDVSDFGLLHLEGPNGAVDVSGTISVSGGGKVDMDTASVAISDASGTGVVQISTSGTAQIDYDYAGTVAFLDPTGTLALGQEGSAYTGTIVGMSSISSVTRDVVDLLLTTSVTGLTPVFTSPTGGVLNVMDNTTTLASLNLLGNYEGTLFNFGTDGNGGTDIFMGCFAAGTRIATPSGDVAVEDLYVSQSVMTADNGSAPIVWLGQRYIDCRRHPRPESVWPVRIRAGAFGDGAPHRDLWLSPDHAVFVDDVLVPVKQLINGTTIEQVRVKDVTYYHVELPSHDLLLAEGLTVESYLDVGDRSNFANSGKATRLFAEFGGHDSHPGAIWEAFGRAPIVVAGPVLDAVRQRLDERAAGIQLAGKARRTVSA